MYLADWHSAKGYDQYGFYLNPQGSVASDFVSLISTLRYKNISMNPILIKSFLTAYH
jgi:hypothetical protein